MAMLAAFEAQLLQGQAQLHLRAVTILDGGLGVVLGVVLGQHYPLRIPSVYRPSERFGGSVGRIVRKNIYSLRGRTEQSPTLDGANYDFSPSKVPL